MSSDKNKDYHGLDHSNKTLRTIDSAICPKDADGNYKRNEN